MWFFWGIGVTFEKSTFCPKGPLFWVSHLHKIDPGYDLGLRLCNEFCTFKKHSMVRWIQAGIPYHCQPLSFSPSNDQLFWGLSTPSTQIWPKFGSVNQKKKKKKNYFFTHFHSIWSPGSILHHMAFTGNSYHLPIFILCEWGGIWWVKLLAQGHSTIGHRWGRVTRVLWSEVQYS